MSPLITQFEYVGCQMPCHHKIFVGENLVAKTFFGRVTTTCVLKLLDDIEFDRDYREGMLEFDDLSGISDLAITPTDIAHIADLLTGLNLRKRKPTKKAIFAPNGAGRAAAHGFSNMVKGVPGIEVGVFGNFETAMRFLGIDSDKDLCRSLEAGIAIHKMDGSTKDTLG